MRRKLSLILTLVAWLFASGSHLDLAQTFAWGRMLAINSTELSFGKALQKTFSAGGRCEICSVIDQARQEQAKNATATAPTGGKLAKDLMLMTAPDAALYLAPDLFHPAIFPVNAGFSRSR